MFELLILYPDNVPYMYAYTERNARAHLEMGYYYRHYDLDNRRFIDNFTNSKDEK